MNQGTFEQEILGYVEEINSIITESKNEKQIDLRRIHLLIVTIIGISKVYDYPVIEELLQGLLLVLDGLSGGRFSFSAKHKQILLVTCEYIKKLISKDEEDKNLSIKNILETYRGIASEEPVDINNSYVNDIIKTTSDTSETTGEISLDSKKEVSVTLNKIDNMIKSINELILNQYQLKTTIESFEKVEFSEKNQRTFVEINNRINSQMLKLERGSNDLQESILALRMLPISIIHNEIIDEIKKIINKSGKNINLILPNKNIIIDKLILQNIQSPIIEVIENSITHGIAKKGDITVDYFEESGKIIIEIIDKGKGLNYDKIRKSSISLFPHDKEDIEDLSDSELIKFIFIEGVTSNKNFKGHGLAKSMECITNIKGTFTLEPNKDSGVTVRISVPKSLTTITGYFIVSGNEKFFIPASYISEILTVNKENILDLVTRQAIKLRDEIIPIYPLSGILDEKESKTAQKLFVLICKVDNESIGIVVDEILYHSSAIYKRLPNNIEGLSPIQGVVFDEEFNIVNILYIPKIVDKLKCIRNIEFNPRYSKDSVDYKSVLIVDDSSINRDIVKNMFIRNGFNVELAFDGIDALQKAKEKYFHLIITDSDMPRMDGATFIENIKKEKGYEGTPIIVLTSTNQQTEIDNFKKVGACSVYQRSNFNRDELLNEVVELIGSKNE